MPLSNQPIVQQHNAFEHADTGQQRRVMFNRQKCDPGDLDRDVIVGARQV